jgi:hypothetical protein
MSSTRKLGELGSKVIELVASGGRCACGQISNHFNWPVGLTPMREQRVCGVIEPRTNGPSRHSFAPWEKEDTVASSSERICSNMNEEHAALVLAYAWAMAGRPAAKRALLTRVTSSAMYLKIDDDARETAVPLEPRLADAKEAQPRMVALRNSCTQVRLTYVANPGSCVFLVVVGMLSIQGFVLEPAATAYFGGLMSRGLLIGLLRLAVVAHVLEATIALVLARMLRLGWDISLWWALGALVGGAPVWLRLRKLLNTARKGRAAAAKAA